MKPFTYQLLLQALHFAATKHQNQRRSGGEKPPYINHPIEVAEVLCTVGEVDDVSTLIAAVLHDTIEDTDATAEEIATLFGEDVLGLVQEVSDDKRLPKKERKQLQIEMAHTRSHRAKLIILGDKICNIRDMTQHPLPGWTPLRTTEYFHWAQEVVQQIQGTNAALEALFAQLYSAAINTEVLPLEGD